jgi:prepilin-type N-terminal cleavage/methylation domain-containing protein
MIKKLKNHRGFTLIEILVSIALIGMVAVTILGLFSASLRNNNASKAVIETTVFAKDIMENLKKELYSLPSDDRDIDIIRAKGVEVQNSYEDCTITIDSKGSITGLYIIQVEVNKAGEGRVERYVSQIYLP